ncbi:MAG: tripartite tricarboxylate transporter TctB family protein [Betaproteobacteria bacterium]|nr:tripartite tricarboxylate transporter TctB family protein [Betaproteobacteria bacterium]
MAEDPNRSSTSGPSTRAIEIFIALFTFALGAIMVFDSRRLGAGWAFDGPQPGYFPFYIGLIICFASLANLATAIVERHQRLVVFVEWARLRQVMKMLVPAALFVGAIPLIGIYVATTVYLAGFMIWVGRYAWYKGIVVGLGTSVFFFLMFEVWFKVPLPKGAYHFLRYLGY